MIELRYCRTGFDSDGLTAAKIATKMIAIVGIHYRNYAHYNAYKSRLLINGVAIVRSQSLLFLDDFEGNVNISVAIKSSSAVLQKYSHGKSCLDIWMD